MPTNILMPALSPTMTEGTLARWLKKEGDVIRAGDVIAEIETDKATMEVEAVDEGVLGKILVADGTAGVKVNDTIAVLEDAAGASPAPAAKPAPRQEAGEVAAPVQATTAPPAATAAPPPAAAPAPLPAHADAGERVAASPLARRMAQQAGIDLASLKGSGPNGRIIRVDVEAARPGAAAAAAAPAQPPQAAPPAAPAAPAAAITEPGRLAPLSNVKRVTARRLTQAKQSVPHFYVSIDVEIDALLALRAQLNACSPQEGDQAYKISVNDMVIKACAAALRRVPGVNASYTDDGVFHYDNVDIAVAVSIPDGLITPIIRKADIKGVAAIAREGRALFERAKQGKLKPAEFQGGTFSISNMGMYGVRDFAAIINPPQAAILAVAAGEQRAVVRAGQLAVATVMTCTISVDHRVIDGALAAAWLAAFKGLIEAPLGLLV